MFVEYFSFSLLLDTDVAVLYILSTVAILGTIHTRLYRKPQKKPLTLHYDSHHTTCTKIATVESMYNTATSVSSKRENEKYSTNIVDSLLLNNGYTEIILTKIKEKKKR